VSPSELLDAVGARLGDAVLERHDERGDATIAVPRERIVSVLTALRDDPELRFHFLMDLTGVDYPDRDPRFEVVYHLASFELEPPSGGHSLLRARLRVKVRVPEHPCALPSVHAVFASANWMEREAWDMYGIRFEGHPDPRRILLYEEFQGHPLRKDYPKTRRQPLVGPVN
jgi:NADH-quinone oxidoreductase subunit C